MNRMRVDGPVWSNGTVPEGSMLGRPVGGGVKPLTPAEAATLLSTPSSSTIGNLLTANQAGATDALSATTGFRVYAGSGTLSSSTAWAANGSRSLALTTAGTGTESVSVSASTAMADRTPVLAGQTYTASAVAYTTAVGETVRIAINFYTSGGASSAGSAAAVVTLTASAPASLSHTVVAPADAAYASVSLERISGGAGSVVYFDKVGLWVGAGGMWAMPGVPITNTGRRVTHPNTDDVLVEVWDSTQNRWQRTRYDSGWRSITASLNGWSGAFYIRRVDDRVDFFVPSSSTLTGSAATAQRFWAAVTGFKKAQNAGNDYVPMSRFNESLTVLLLSNDHYLGGGSSYVSTTYTGCRASYDAEASLPTSLPGTLVSSAPA